MTRIGFAAMAMMFVLGLGLNATAQKNDISGGIGRVFISDQGVNGTNLSDNNIHFEDHLSYSASYGRRLMNIPIASLTAEVPFVYDPQVRLSFGINVVPKSFTAYYVTPSLRLNLFPRTGFSPWVSGGGGFAHFNQSSTLEFGSPNPGEKSTTTSAIQFGIGLDVRLLGPLKLRGEARDFFTGLPDLNINPQKRMHNYFVGAGAVFSF